MGQEKIRKKNGTYPTPEQIAHMAEYDRRINTSLWYPKASDLSLPYVPEQRREAVRSLLASFVQEIPVKAGNCWWTAQTFAHLADTQRVRYVEGLWTRSPENEFYSPDVDHTGAPHACNLVDGYLVCLTGEFYRWRFSGEDAHWYYEPLKDFSIEDVREALKGHAGDDYYDTLIMSEQLFWKERSDDESFLPEHLHIEHQPEPKDYGQPSGNYITNRAAYHAWMESSEQDRWSAAHDKWWEERNNFVQGVVFKSAADRLIQRYAQQAVAA
jgi:hypothetical protein